MDSVASAKTQYILNEKVSQSKEAVKKLKKALKEVKDAQQHLHEKGQHLRDALNVVASHESFKPLSQLVSMCSDKVKKVEEERMSNICTRMEDTVTKRMEALMKDVEHMDKTVKDRADLEKKVATAEKKAQQAVGKGDQARAQAEEAQVTLQNKFDGQNKLAVDDIKKFEQDRVKQVKEILQEFFTCTMYVDCRSLEAYTPVLQALEAIDPDTAMEELGGKLDEAAREF